MGFITLYTGLLMKSSKAAVISSFLLVLFTQGSIGDYSLAGNTIVPVVLTAVSFIAAGLSVWNVETKDLM